MDPGTGGEESFLWIPRRLRIFVQKIRGAQWPALGPQAITWLREPAWEQSGSPAEEIQIVSSRFAEMLSIV